MIEGDVDEATLRHMTEGFKRVPIGRLVEVDEIANVDVYITERGMQTLHWFRRSDRLDWPPKVGAMCSRGPMVGARSERNVH